MNSPRETIKLIYTWLKMAEIKAEQDRIKTNDQALARLADYMGKEINYAKLLCLVTGLPPRALFACYALHNSLPTLHQADFIRNAGIEAYLFVISAGGIPAYVDRSGNYIFDEAVLYPKNK